ncbi:P-loop containing nucleoside triphosphate hydrolase protein [Halteromyces radiatus]|uniref:P-loop containing nucleoside triphosphate hydrolase protein n=1 Tax=Halteromyces radiatus TaxID=101107 RepID=UPI00222054B4|nr:P-loop containing nucleoside triphosphate hydrolase protein [Halteromyces radiatus]KAI8097430.1 P-loop containing nucleoside triphosphate hydrolase protein [Halteromyces radiatus]
MGCFPPEVDHQGNIEYKLKLVDPSEERLEHLITQLKWRLTEGEGQALYELGVNDNGSLTGLSDQDMTATLNTLRRMAAALNAEVSIVQEMKINQPTHLNNNYKKMNDSKKKNKKKQSTNEVNNNDTQPRCIIEALVRLRTPLDLPTYTDIRMAIIGDTGSGKSTFLAHISHGIKDTGHGTARISLLRHPHEIETGNTSSIAHEMIGYTADGILVNSASSSSSSFDDAYFFNDNNDYLDSYTWEQICATSSKVVTFLDTCGHSKYLRTTISALTGYAPDYALLVVSATLGDSAVTEMTKEHISLVLMLDVPLSVVITKIDLATNDQIQSCIQALQAFLSSMTGVHHQRRLPVVITPFPFQEKNNNNNQEQQNLIGVHSATNAASAMMDDESTIPIFLVSNVTGAYMNLVHSFLNALAKPTRKKSLSSLTSSNLLEEPVEFQIEQVYTLSDVGIVIGGVLRQGRINIHDPEQSRTFALGPNSQGHFIQATVVSIHRHRISSHYVHCGQTASLAIKLTSSSSSSIDERRQQQQHHHSWGKIKKGMVLLAINDDRPPESYTIFEASVLVLYHATGLKKGTCGMLRSGFIRQQARVIDIQQGQQTDDDVVVTSGQQATCVFQLLGDPEYLRLEAQFLFLEGSFKCLGSITKLVGKVTGKWIK